jgi:hypothetical protein
LQTPTAKATAKPADPEIGVSGNGKYKGNSKYKSQGADLDRIHLFFRLAKHPKAMQRRQIITAKKRAQYGEQPSIGVAVLVPKRWDTKKLAANVRQE